MAGDVGIDGLGLDAAGEALLASCQTVIHSAAAVSFDSPLDSAVEINLLGPVRVATTLARLHHDQAADPPAALPHLIAVSTAYVAGSRRGRAPEAMLADTPWSTEVPWRPEVDAARRARADSDADSRGPDRLAGFQRRARHELGAAGAPLLAAKAERLREEWVKDRMVDHRQGARPGSGLARRLRLHQVARRAGPARDERRSAAHDRPAVHHRVIAVRALPGLDSWLSHGRPGDHLLRQGAAQGVPRRPGGHRRRDPGRSGRRLHHGRRRSRPAGSSPTSSTRHRAPAIRSGTVSWSIWYRRGSSRIPWPTARTSPLPSRSGRSRAATGSSASCARPPGRCRRPRRPSFRCRCAVARPTGAHAWKSAGTRRNGRCPMSSYTARTPKPKQSSRWTDCSIFFPHCPRKTSGTFASIRPSSTGPISATTSTFPPSSLTPGCARRQGAGARRRDTQRSNRHDPGGAGPARRPGARTTAGRLRPREHPHRVERRRFVRLAGHPPLR